MQNENALSFCKSQIEQMLKRSQTKVIFPLITLGLVKEFQEKRKEIFTDNEIKEIYENTVREIKRFLGHDLHVGGRYYDAYPSRNLPKYNVLKVQGNKQYQLLEPYKTEASALVTWIPSRIEQHIVEKLNVIPKLGDRGFRIKISEDKERFLNLLGDNIDRNPANFEIFSFAIIKLHLEKFACRIYRDKVTSAHDRGVDIATDFGVVYQVKKLKVINKADAEGLYTELKNNFDKERLDDGKVILIIDDISKYVKNYLINMKIQSISKKELLHLAQQIEDAEDREKLLRIIYEEFRREYSSVI
jgi:hypothetical protein